MASSLDYYQQKSTPNPRIVEEILKEPHPFWGSRFEGTEHKPYELIALKSSCVEYLRIKSLFDSTSRGLVTISTIHRIENPFLLAQYVMKKEKMRKGHCYVQEMSMFHGTKIVNIDGICKNNFDWRRRGQSRGHKFGQGVSFSPSVSFANQFTTDKVFILAKVLVDREIIGNVTTQLPPFPYDTTTNGKNTVYVKYEDDDFYPSYVINCGRGVIGPQVRRDVFNLEKLLKAIAADSDDDDGYGLFKDF